MTTDQRMCRTREDEGMRSGRPNDPEADRTFRLEVDGTLVSSPVGAAAIACYIRRATEWRRRP